MTHPDLAALDTLGRIEACAQDIADLEIRLGRAPLWQPGTVLIRQAVAARQIIRNMQARLDGHLVATLIGPSGAGKSTIFNVLAGADDLSPTGIQRPTTRDLVVLAADPQAARHCLGPIDPDRMTLRSGPATGRLAHLILVDTPDTDSTQSPSHLDLLFQVVERSDVLICVFDAQNPKRRDHADFMAPLVGRFNGASLVAVVNKCDRLGQEELHDAVGPDFEAYLKKAWPTFPQSLLLVSARTHLRNPGWDEHAEPRHSLDQFAQLQEMVLETLNQPGAGRDRRVANAARIRDYLAEAVGREAARHQAALSEAAGMIAQAEQNAMQAALSALRSDDRRYLMGVNARLYQALAQRWLGPVGWLVAIWSRLIIFGSGLAALVRFGNPLRQVWGLVSTWKRYRQSRSALEMFNDPSRADAALAGFQKSLLTQWPDIARILIAAGFDPALRAMERLAPENEAMSRTLDAMWSEALEAQINRWADRLSHWFLQLLFNLPGLIMLGYVGWLTAVGFFSRHYLSSDFFVHALLTIAIVLLLCFFLLQGLVRLAVGRSRIQRGAFDDMGSQMAEHPQSATRNIAAQVAAVTALAETPPDGPGGFRTGSDES
jgi:energy-coupling factor transporter ATP-binding protein EcfA2